MTFQQRSQWNYYPEASCPEGTSCTRTWLQQSFCWVSANLAVIWWWENMGNVVFPRSLRFSWHSQNLWIDLPQKTFWTYCHQWDFFEHQGEWFIFFQMLAWCFAASDLNAKCQSHLDDTDPRWTARSNHSIHRQTKDFTVTILNQQTTRKMGPTKRFLWSIALLRHVQRLKIRVSASAGRPTTWWFTPTARRWKSPGYNWAK